MRERSRGIHSGLRCQDVPRYFNSGLSYVRVKRVMLCQNCWWLATLRWSSLNRCFDSFYSTRDWLREGNGPKRIR